jgi:hypothetical protein
MKEVGDLWYVRLPDGRVFRAAGTGALRQHVEAGRIPAGSLVRRRGDEGWRRVEQARELGEAEPVANGAHGGESPTVAARLDPTQLHLVGVRGLLDDLLVALDSTFARRKLTAALLCGLFLAVLVAVAGMQTTLAKATPTMLGVALLVVGATVGLLTVLLTQMTFTELSRMRPAHWGDALEGAGGLFLRVGVLYALVGGTLGSLIAVLRWLPGLVFSLDPDPAATPLLEWGAHVTAVLAVVLEVALWPFVLLLMLLGTLVVVERCPIWSALAQWFGLLRRHLGRLLLAEALALSVGLVLVVPFALPVVAVCSYQPDEALRTTVQLTRVVLGGLVGALLVAYLTVANVFVYLAVRYELGK